jgi:hypothetical protein
LLQLGIWGTWNKLPIERVERALILFDLRCGVQRSLAHPPVISGTFDGSTFGAPQAQPNVTQATTKAGGLKCHS